MMQPIGGYLPLERFRPPAARSVLDLWRAGPENSWMFVNARSALAHLVAEQDVGRLLLPAFICPELVSAAGSRAVVYYPLTPDLSPDAGWLESELAAGDCVVAVDYFGRPPGPAFRDLASRRGDILWVEDCAQALAPDPWAKWVLYSPRKLFGVPDGGILVHLDGPVDPPRHAAADVFAATMPRVSADGFAAYRQAEDRMRVCGQAMSRLTVDLLAAIDPGPVLRRRRANYGILAGLLADHALFRAADEPFTPMGFPLRVADRDAVWQRLIDAGMYAVRHWAALPSDPAAFPFEHALSRSILTLPCDQRYDAGDMRRLAAAFKDACR